MDIACATDDAYAPHCATMLQSLFAQHRGAPPRVHLLHAPSLAGDSLARLQRVVQRHGAAFCGVPVADDLVRGFPDARFHVSCWYRVLLPTLRPELRRVLYLDADLLVLGSLNELWRTDLRGRMFAAAINPLYPFMPDHLARLGLRDPREYLNSGVLLMDLDAWRAGEVQHRLRAYAAAHPDNPWPEQDALSVVCRGRWLELHPRWNAQTTLFDLKPAELPLPAAQVDAAVRDPAIVHFIGPLKPWRYLCRHPLRHLYATHRRDTPWPVFQLEGRTLGNFLLRPLGLGLQLKVQLLLRSFAARRRDDRMEPPPPALDRLLHDLDNLHDSRRSFWRRQPDHEVRLLCLFARLQTRFGSRGAAARALARALALRPGRRDLWWRLLVTLVGRGAWRAYRRLPGRWLDQWRRRPRGPRLMQAFGRCYPEATFVQIGSNDGAKHDPLRRTLRRHRWSGVMIEPVPYVFARLQKHYGRVPGIALENVAVSATAASGALPFYYVAEADGEALPDWYDELGSFRKDVVLSHADRVPNLEQRLVTMQVPCTTLAALCEKHRLAAVDLVHMDTEGYDGELIAGLDLERVRPALLIYEHAHLDDVQRRATRERLRRHGYALFEEGPDTWCADLRAAGARQRRFLRAWSRIVGDRDAHAEAR